MKRKFINNFKITKNISDLNLQVYEFRGVFFPICSVNKKPKICSRRIKILLKNAAADNRLNKKSCIHRKNLINSHS